MTYMSDDEIRQRYKLMDDAEDRVQILAELNDCGKRVIMGILRGEKIDRAVKRFDENYIGFVYKRDMELNDRAINMYRQGCTVNFIARALGISVNTICRWQRKNGFSSKDAVQKNAEQIREQNAKWQDMFDKGLL